ncbi:MAG: hypothetical protein QM622_10275 [Microbacterium sp.]
MTGRGSAGSFRQGMLEGEGAEPVRVRFVEVSPESIVVKAEDYGDVTGGARRLVLPWPLPARLRPPRPDDPDGLAPAR